MREKIYLFDTTLRDGSQTQGVDFSIDDKNKIALALSSLGLDYIEGGWPGANPLDTSFFNTPPKMNHSKLVAFGMTKKTGRSAENDPGLASLINANTSSVCIVGKTWDYHVKIALNISKDENLENIKETTEHFVKHNREYMFDAEHFFDGYKNNKSYALDCIKTAYNAGARWIVLCDTNGGTLPNEVSEIVLDVCKQIPGSNIGIHAHNDTENAVANSLAAILAGARQIQGTLNGLGERCGNANLVSIIPTLLLKEPYASQFDVGVSKDALKTLTRTSRLLDDILNRVPSRQAPYVGSAAFAHKAGLHASAILKDPSTYEHIDPSDVGNTRIIPMSNQAGQSNLIKRLRDAGIRVEKGDPALGRILDVIKSREAEGYSYDTAQASFEILARRELGILPNFFEVKRYRVTVERRKNKYDKMVSLSEAVVVVKIDGDKKLSVSESMDETGSDRGPVNALAKALAKDLGPYQDIFDDMHLVDFKVRITQGGTEAVTRVVIDSQDSSGQRWATVGVSPNIVDASFEALLDAITWKIMRDTAKQA